MPDQIDAVDGIHRGPAFAKAVRGYLTTEGGRETSALLNLDRYTAKDTDISYRVANYWQRQGLIEDRREDGRGWRKFSVLDLVWLKILMRLRAFGYPLNKLQIVRSELFDRMIRSQGEEGQASFLEMYAALALLHRKPTYVLVFLDGRTETVYFEQFNASLQVFGIDDHVHINLNTILQDLFPHTDLSPKYETTVDVDADELEVLFLLRTGAYDSITIKRKNGRIDKLEAEEMISGKKLVDLLSEEDYQDVIVRRRDGRDVGVTRRILKKLK